MKCKFVFFLLFVGLNWHLVHSQSLVYAQKVGGPGIDDANGIATDGNGNVYITGRFQDIADFDPGPGVYNLISEDWDDAFVCKFNTFGNLIWAKSFGGYDVQEGLAIDADNQGNVLIAVRFRDTVDFDPGPGVFNLVSNGGMDACIVKLDPSGNFLWAKSYGGNTGEEPLSIEVDVFGNVLTTGFFTDNVDFDPGPGTYNISVVNLGDAYILKLTSSGDFMWVKAMGGTGNVIGLSVETDQYGNVYSIGYYNSTADFDPDGGIYNLTPVDSYDIYVTKFDFSGALIWARSIGGSNIDKGEDLCVSNSGDVYLTGSFTIDCDFDPGAGTNMLFSNGASDIYITKLDSNGNFVWADQIGGTDGEIGNAIVLDTYGNVYVAGSYSGTVDFDPGAGIFNLTSTAGNYNAFIEKIDTAGNFIYVLGIGENSYAGATSISADPMSYVYITGNFSGTGDFDPGPDTLLLQSNGPSYDVYVHKLIRCENLDTSMTINGTTFTSNTSGALYEWLDCSTMTVISGETGQSFTTAETGSYACIVSIDGCTDTSTCFEIDISSIDNPNDPHFVLYPNPSNGLVFVQLNLPANNVDVKVKTIQGKVVYCQYKMKSNLLEIDLSEFGSGMYIFEITMNNVVKRIKVLIE